MSASAIGLITIRTFVDLKAMIKKQNRSHDPCVTTSSPSLNLYEPFPWKYRLLDLVCHAQLTQLNKIKNIWHNRVVEHLRYTAVENL